ARGYAGRLEATAELFLPDPFAADGSRLYRSGDRVRRRADGELEFLGRVDEQIKVRGFRIEPGEVEAALRAHPEVAAAAVVARDDDGTGSRLVAYLVPDDLAAGIPDTGALRAFLQQSLPAHLIPAVFVELSALPLSPSGKTDRAALPVPEGARPALTAGYVAPRTPAEELIADVWAEILRLERVGATDNFFELGGDSILSIQAVARARARGLHVTPAQLFEHQTVAGLAAVAAREAAFEAEQGPVSGEVPLTPIHHWFFGRGLPEPGHFNQSVTVEIAEHVEPAVLRQALVALVAHHDALRLRFTSHEGRMSAQCLAAEPEELFSVVDLSGLGAAEARDRVAEAAEAAQRGLDLAAGPVARFVLFDHGEPGQVLLLVAHHAVVDGVSWRILLEDLALACAQLERGAPIALPAKTTSFQRWAERLRDLAGSPQLEGEAAYWRAVGGQDADLPLDHPGSGNDVASARTVDARLDEEQTARLLHRVPAAYRTQINDVLLTALGVVVAEWTGGDQVLIDLEGHGREDVGTDVDVSRTVGWFTSLYPVRLPMAAGPGDLGSLLKSTKERLREIPRHGLGYGLLRHLAGGETGETLAATPGPQVAFNYLGQFDQGGGDAERFRTAEGTLGRERADTGERTHLIEVNGLVVNGRLELGWTYSEWLHDRATVERLAARYVEVLEELIDHCCRPGAGGYTPSDFPLAGLDQNTLDRIHADAGQPIDDLYPLTATQQGMLFHTLLEPGSGVYVVQNGIQLDGELDTGALILAWELALARHPVLRAQVVSEGVPVPLHLVPHSAAPAVDVHDWRRRDRQDQERALEEFLAADRARGLPLDRPGAMRVTLIRTADTRHQMVWSYHHLLLDGWSAPIVLGEVLDAYQAYRTGREPDLPGHRPYRDFVAWLAARDQGEAEDFWRGHLRGFDAPTPLAVDGDTGDHGHTTIRAELPQETTEALTDLARRHHLTLSTVVQGAWAVLLSAYSGEDDVMFGVTTSGRTEELPGAESMVGLFITTTPLRARIDQDAKLLPWLEELQAEQIQARRHEHTPLVRIQACSDVPAGQPLFNSLLLFENYPSGEFDDQVEAAGADGLLISDGVAAEQVNYPLTIIAAHGPSLALGVAYDRAHLTHDSAGRLLAHLSTLLTAVAADPDRRVAELPILGPAERELVVSVLNDTAAHTTTGTALDLIAEQVARRPGAVAVVSGDERLTYAELDALADRLAHHLRGLGVGPETVVGLCLPRGLDMVVALLAVLKAGGAYLPLDPEYPAERLEFMLADSRAPVLVGHRETAGALAGDGGVVWLDDPATAAALDGAPSHAPAVAVQPGQLAYVIYTSGSTGRPKGVQVTHGGVVNLVAAQRLAFGVEPGDVVLQFAPFSFDAAVWEVFMALAVGATLDLATTRARSEPAALAALAAADGATVATVPPSLLGQLEPGALPGVTTLITAGERLSPELAGVWGRGRRLYNAYGPTETTVCASMALCDEADAGAPPIGGPIANTRVYVLDRHLQPVPVGVPGELFVGGNGLARGYGGQPELTAERFLADPFAGDGARLYRTGDRVRWRPDGQLEFLGRVDEQVKVRGHRVEPGEVEAALRAHPQIAAAVVVGAEQRLAAYLVPADHGEGIPSAGELRAFLLAGLPDYLVPSVFVELAALPLSPSGKVDRAALPAPVGGSAGSGAAYVAPRTPTEEMLAGIWAQVLGLDRVGVLDEFFELGGHSLLATQVMSRVRAAFGAELPLATLFDHPTVAGLAAAVDGSAGRTRVPPIVPVGRDRLLPLSFAQQRLWFLAQLEPDSLEYNLPIALRLAGALDLSALGAALDAIVERHEVLRTRLVTVDGVPHQVVGPASEVKVEVVDLSGDPDALGRAEQLAAADAAAPFDLAQGPLFRGRLIRLAPDDHVLSLVLHHVIWDEWSAGVLRRELTALYEAFSRGEPSPLPPLAVQYADFAVWQREWLQGEVLEGQLGYWRERLEGAPVLELPTDRPRPAVRTSAGGVVDFEVPAETLSALRGVTQQSGATMFMTLLSAFTVLLGKYAGQDDVVVGTPIANRNRAEVEDLIGFFVNTLVLRTDLSGDPAFADLVGRVRSEALGAYAHQDVPFEQLVEAFAADRDRGRHPLFQVLFNYYPAEADEAGSGGVDLDSSTVELPVAITSKFDLRLILMEEEQALKGAVEFSTELFDRSTVERMVGHLVRLLGVVAADPS
ncbi:amino acid adenylation domain-containing protein, partial [Nonomuraea sp. NPDC049784]|uniref:amino acid adenylation domain-containing protein n=1 Tax=Nonomuraea sp. NPDC049784 TaxID=3154361 RepID=UPI0033E9AE19